jgi:hypothetical protein
MLVFKSVLVLAGLVGLVLAGLVGLSSGRLGIFFKAIAYAVTHSLPHDPASVGPKSTRPARGQVFYLSS